MFILYKLGDVWYIIATYIVWLEYKSDVLLVW